MGDIADLLQDTAIGGGDGNRATAGVGEEFTGIGKTLIDGGQFSSGPGHPPQRESPEGED